MTVITMSRNELTRLRVPIDVADGRLSVADATGLIGVGRRQIYRLLQAFRADGADGLISRKRGGPSNRALGSVYSARPCWPSCVSATPILVRPWRRRSGFFGLAHRSDRDYANGEGIRSTLYQFYYPPDDGPKRTEGLTDQSLRANRKFVRNRMLAFLSCFYFRNRRGWLDGVIIRPPDKRSLRRHACFA
jgi:hypothetical protein